MKNKKKNPTTQVVRAAMKETAKDVRAPKVVRDGIVKKKEKKINPSNVKLKINIAAKSAVNYIILNDSIKLKTKHIRNITAFSYIRQAAQIPSVGDEEFGNIRYVPDKLTCEDVVVEVDVRMKKMAKILELFHTMRKITFNMVNTSGLKITSTGFIKSIEHDLEGNVSFTYCPDYFSVL